MDPNRDPPTPSGFLHVPPSNSRRRTSSPGPGPTASSSRLSPNPPTPGAGSDVFPDYFDPLMESSSYQSHRSVSRSSRPGSSSASTGFPPHPRRSSSIDGARQPSIRLRRSSNASIASSTHTNDAPQDPVHLRSDIFNTTRPRSVSQPERAHVAPDGFNLARHSRRVPQVAMPRLTEEGNRPTLAELGLERGSNTPISPTRSLPDNDFSYDPELPPATTDGTGLARGRRLSRMFWPRGARRSTIGQGQAPRLSEAANPDDEYAQELVDWLDIIDPEVQTLATLTNVQNSLFVPDLGSLINRRPTYVLSSHQPEQQWASRLVTAGAGERPLEPEPAPEEEDVEPDTPPIQRSSTITSHLTDSHYAALPHGTNLEGWSAQDKADLDDHVRHMLHSRRSRWKRRLKGFGQYVRRPLGFFVTLYATLITLFGLAWVLFLIGWIYVGEKQVYTIHIIDSVLVALFAIMGDGLAPFRAVDTYHMFFVARYSRMIKRAEQGKRPRSRLRKRSVPDDLPENADLESYGRITSQQAREILEASGPCGKNKEKDNKPENPENPENPESPESPETPDNLEEGDPNVDRLNSGSSSDNDIPALTMKQLKSLQHHQKKLAKSHSFYKPQETFTHHAFPLSYLIAIVVLLDCHSCLQISLGACTWGIDYHHRPFAITTVILCVSITCNITAGLMISFGDKKTRKKDVWELLNRQELTGDAMKHIAKKKKEQKKEQEKELEKLEKQALKEAEKEKELENSDGQSGSSSKIGKLIKVPS
ncbi:hypothetical protein BGZ63DRAFT_354791 [Mariannaea sp. PMI_226]|nr:hypothetical protein BGZ63DRAFT_354791 [Mariannaea sp. PMI_226]